MSEESLLLDEPPDRQDEAVDAISAALDKLRGEKKKKESSGGGGALGGSSKVLGSMMRMGSSKKLIGARLSGLGSPVDSPDGRASMSERSTSDGVRARFSSMSLSRTTSDT